MKQSYWEIIKYRSFAFLFGENQRSYFGILWWLIEPVLYMSVFYLVFGYGLRQGGADFVPFLLCGLTLWKWFDSSVKTSTTCIINNATLMSQVHLPKILFPLIIVLSNTVKFGIIFSVLVVFLILYGIEITEKWWAIPVVLVVLFTVLLTMSLLVAAVVPFFDDIKYIVTYGMTMLFFMSGIFFDLKRMSDQAQQIFQYNPIAMIIDSFRGVMLYQSWPNWTALLVIEIIFILILILVIGFYKRNDRIFPRVVG